jgi:EAL domain-containing protein (putative c-di-GMP-specific phosphodiesterase class I)
MRDSGVPPDKVILELSERASLGTDADGMPVPLGETAEALADYRVALTDFTRSLHVRFAIDDFGVERANIIRLVGLNLSYVKVDRSIVYGPTAALTFAYVNQIMSQLGDHASIIAEGWEEEAPITIKDLRGAGCTLIQGFGLGQPHLNIIDALEEARVKSERLVPPG